MQRATAVTVELGFLSLQCASNLREHLLQWERENEAILSSQTQIQSLWICNRTRHGLTIPEHFLMARCSITAPLPPPPPDFSGPCSILAFQQGQTVPSLPGFQCFNSKEQNLFHPLSPLQIPHPSPKSERFLPPSITEHTTSPGFPPRGLFSPKHLTLRAFSLESLFI